MGKRRRTEGHAKDHIIAARCSSRDGLERPDTVLCTILAGADQAVHECIQWMHGVTLATNKEC